MLSGCLGQVDSTSGQVPFHSYLPNGQGVRQVVCQLNHLLKGKLRLVQGKQNLRDTCRKGSWNSRFFSSPELYNLIKCCLAFQMHTCQAMSVLCKESPTCVGQWEGGEQKF